MPLTVLEHRLDRVTVSLAVALTTTSAKFRTLGVTARQDPGPARPSAPRLTGGEPPATKAEPGSPDSRASEMQIPLWQEPHRHQLTLETHYAKPPEKTPAPLQW